MRDPKGSRGSRTERRSRVTLAPSELELRNVTEAFHVVLDNVGARQEADERLDLAMTPERVAKMYGELLSSYKPGALDDLKRRFTTFPQRTREVVSVGPVAFSSLCSHHIIPFTGQAYVSYLSGNKIVGLSKVARVVEFFSRKLQLQERLTQEIADFLVEHLQPKAVMVHVRAEHLCMSMRGVRAPGVFTKTTALRGWAVTKPSVRAEFLASIPVDRV